MLLFKNLCTISAKAINKEPTHPHSGTKKLFLEPFWIESSEPTQPQAGTKIECRHRNRLSYRPNQPIPTRGRKLDNKLGMFDNGGNQPNPKRGRKLESYYITNKCHLEPTHPHSGTKIAIRRNVPFCMRNQPIPKRGRTCWVITPNCHNGIEPTHPQAGTKMNNHLPMQPYKGEPTHPHSGTKIECRHRNRLSYQPNQPIPKRGRKLVWT